MAEAVDAPFIPQWSGELELMAPSLPEQLTDAGGTPLAQARILVRAAGIPLGFAQVDCPDGRADLDRLVQAAETSFAVAAAAARARPLWTDDVGDLGQELVSIVLCTSNRAAGAGRTLESLLALRHSNIEVIVVDNAPQDEATRVLVEQFAERDDRIRYVRERRRGLSRARNRGLDEATGRFIAFTDDDVRVDPLWVNGLLRGFATAPEVACVTGLVASASLEHPAEQYFDRRVWWSSSCEPRLFTAQRCAGDPALHPYSAGVFGTGANFAAAVDTLRSLGGFDECLGAGSPAQGGEDLDMFVRLLTAGHSLKYEPAALVWHEHRVDDESLRRQMYAYGLGLAAYATKHLLASRSRAALMRRAPGAMRHLVALMRRSRRAASGSVHQPREMTEIEVRGMLAGPSAYLRARRGADPNHLRAVAP